MRLQRKLAVLAALTLAFAGVSSADAACCYFSAKNSDVLQPGQKVFITWDPDKKDETFTVQPKFEGNALDFGMVIPTPTQPKLHEMPKDFFKNLAVYSILTAREFPRSKLLPKAKALKGDPAAKKGGAAKKGAGGGGDPLDFGDTKPPPVVILEEGVVGSLDYKIITAERADDLYKWLKDNKYSYSGDEATLNFYVQQKWIFTVMKIDTMQMKKEQNGQYVGDVTPTRFKFTSDKLVYPLKITQISVKDKTEALFYVQAPYKVDLKGDMSYQLNWIPLLESSGKKPGKSVGSKKGMVPPASKNLPGRGTEWLQAIQDQIPSIYARNAQLEYNYVPGQRPVPNAKGHTPTTMEWARKLSEDDVAMLQGKAPFCEKVPDVDEGFTQADLQDPQKAAAVTAVIRDRLTKALQEHPTGYRVRYVPEEDIRALKSLIGHLQAGLWITKFRKVFCRDEMNADLLLVAARLGDQDDFSEYTEILPTSPP
ncbi:MAG TPA: DUF2330 domain-containing protein [Gemmataceae bacterium]|nr:DUF2330 domain-containing protein [Gemmataceae bacterium]